MEGEAEWDGKFLHTVLQYVHCTLSRRRKKGRRAHCSTLLVLGGRDKNGAWLITFPGHPAGGPSSNGLVDVGRCEEVAPFLRSSGEVFDGAKAGRGEKEKGRILKNEKRQLQFEVRMLTQ